MVFTCQAIADTSVWEIKKNHSIVYLGGTLHALSATDYPLPKAFEQAYRRSQVVYFEVDLKDFSDQKIIDLMAQKLSYPSAVTLKSKLTDATWLRLDRYLKQHGSSAYAVNNYRPGAILSAALSFEMTGVGATAGGVDHYFYQKSVSDNRDVLALESAEAQIDMLAVLGDQDEDLFINRLIADMDSFSAEFNRLRSAWLHGDKAGLVMASGINTLKREDPSTYRVLLSARNKKWIVAVEEMFDTAAIEFVLVGAMHLVGEDGLLKLLLDNGYTVTQMQQH